MVQRQVMSFVAAGIAVASLWSTSATAQMYPVQATGWNRDVVIERTATAPWSGFAQSFDTFNGWAWYERGLGTSTKGLPQGGAFASVVDPTTLGQLEPYDTANALFLDATTPTGSLALVPSSQLRYDALAIFASSSNGGGVGTMTITFTDTSTSAVINFNAQDWFNVTTNNALNNLGRGNLAGSTTDDASASNPRIYQTTIDMVALGLNNRNVQSISFTKPPVAGAAHNTVVMAISGRRSVLQLNPVAATGWNRDIVVESGATAPFASFASSFDVGNNLAFYERTLPASTKGLPVGGAFNSVSNSLIAAQLEPYNGPNALFLHATVTAPTGVLTLAPAAQVPYEFLAVFATSAGGGGAGNMVITFTDSSTSGTIPFNAQDWFNVTTNNGLNNLGRSNLNTNVVDDASTGNPRVYQTVVDLAALGLNSRAIASIAFTKPTAGSAAAVLALSGQPASTLPGACCVANGTCLSATLAGCLSPNLFQGPGTTCGSGATCPVVTSACCNTTSGVCVFVNGTTCASGFAAQGAGTLCSPNICPQSGACCAASGGCTLGTAAACPAPALFQGLGTACGVGAICPATVSACCNATNGACVFISGTTCAAGFDNQGAGSVCSPSPCPPAGSCCTGANNQSCTVIIQTACTGIYNGNNTVCSPNPCFTSDECSTTTLVLTLGTTVTGSNVGATNSGAVTQTGTGFCNQTTFSTGTALDVFWKFTAPATAVYDIHTCGSTLDTILSVHNDCPVSNANLVDCNDDSTSGTGNVSCATVVSGSSGLGSHIPTITLTEGTVYYIRIAGFNGASGNYSLTINLVGAVGSCCVSTACAQTDQANCSGVWTSGASCSPNPCGGPTGVCCRGATCSTTITDASACSASLIGGQTAGASFPTGAACNTTGVTTSPCCYADYNKANGIGVQDIFDFLGDWFAGSPYANTGGSGGPDPLSVQNIFDFLGAWFAGGC